MAASVPIPIAPERLHPVSSVEPAPKSKNGPLV